MTTEQLWQDFRKQITPHVNALAVNLGEQDATLCTDFDAAQGRLLLLQGTPEGNVTLRVFGQAMAQCTEGMFQLAQALRDIGQNPEQRRELGDRLRSIQTEVEQFQAAESDVSEAIAAIMAETGGH